MTKNKIKQRLLDIAAGAGLIWDEHSCYWDNWSNETFGLFVIGIESAFELPESSRLRKPWQWKEFDDLASLVDLVHHAIEYDLED